MSYCNGTLQRQSAEALAHPDVGPDAAAFEFVSIRGVATWGAVDHGHPESLTLELRSDPMLPLPSGLIEVGLEPILSDLVACTEGYTAGQQSLVTAAPRWLNDLSAIGVGRAKGVATDNSQLVNLRG